VLQPRLEIQALRGALLAARQLQDVFDDSVHALGVVLNDLRQTIRTIEFLGLPQQLRGMTDGAQRIADFMGDAGGQAPERGEFQLLGLLRDCARSSRNTRSAGWGSDRGR
jgi:hypothetical protein